jgi:hypothetical protein
MKAAASILLVTSLALGGCASMDWDNARMALAQGIATSTANYKPYVFQAKPVVDTRPTTYNTTCNTWGQQTNCQTTAQR